MTFDSILSDTVRLLVHKNAPQKHAYLVDHIRRHFVVNEPIDAQINLYATMNVKNNRVYIGVHSSSAEYADAYIGSGKYLGRSVAKHGRHVFIKAILKTFNTKEQALASESMLVNNDVVRATDYNGKLFFNLKVGGKGFWQEDVILITNGTANKSVSEFDFVTMYENLGYVRGRTYGERGPRGKVWINRDGIQRLAKGNELSTAISEGWRTGRIYNGNLDRIWLHHSKFGRKRVFEDEIGSRLNEGWTLGIGKMHNGGQAAGKIWINDGCSEKMTHLDVAESITYSSWHRGRIKRVNV